MADYTFQGWLGRSADAVNGRMEWGVFEPKVWTEDDVDIKITHCGVCGSDLHTLRSGWGPTPYPCCVGHEIVGHAVRVGKNVSHIKLGDRVGVGAEGRSCLNKSGDCVECAAGLEQYCSRGVIGTYAGIYPDNEGKSYGGYGDYNRSHAQFVFRIPDGLPSEFAAPMLCGGVTVYSPLKKHGCGPGKRVGIIGVGGLGHFGLLFAKALGADEVVGISRKRAKEAEALQLGADRYIATAEPGEKDWAAKNKRTLDLVVCTVSSESMALEEYLSLLKVGGKFVQVGAPEGNLPPINAFTLIVNGIFLGGSSIGSPADIREMLEFATEKKIQPWVQTRPLQEANQVILDMDAGKAKYRYVLVNEKHANEGK